MMSTDICRWLFLLISLSTWITYTNSKEMRVVCYYTNWSVYRPGTAKFSPQNINPYLCTHLIYAFGGFTKENTLKPFDKYQDIEKGGYAKFTGLKTYNKNLKTMLAIGGWNEGSSRFSPMVANAERRKELVKNAVKFLRQNHFDGLDLDWEYPTFRDGGKPRDRDNYVQLVKELREEFERESQKTGRTRLILTMAVPAGIEYINKGFDVPKLTKYLDWMNILSYDYHSAFEPAVNHHAPLYALEEDNEYNYDGELNIDFTIKHYLKQGADPSKLVLGIPTYGRSYTLFNPDAFEIGSPADGPGDMGDATRENGYLAYYEICEYIKSNEWEVEQPNPKAMGPYAFKDNQWVGYDDEDIVRKKSQYVAENGLGGIMFWAIDNDDFRGSCHGKPYPLIEAAKEALLNAYGLTDENLISPPSKSTKTRSRSRAKAANKVESDDEEEVVKVSKSTNNDRRRNRNRSRSKTEEVTEKPSIRKTRRKDSRKTTEQTSTYSSLKVVTPSWTTPAPPSTPDMGGGFKCEDEGFFSHPTDCKKYYWCLNGAADSGIVAHQFTCPAGLYFNKAADSCDYTQNVICNKKKQKVTTTISTEAPTTASTTAATELFSTSRVPPKITAATSRTTLIQGSTTEADEEDYEYEDEDDEEGVRSEEDPRVIKELIDLIRKAGGIEELEKQLGVTKNESTSSGAEATTPTAISKSLYERVLSKAVKSSLTSKKNSYLTLRNSRGPQNDGLGKTEENTSANKKSDRGKLQYTSISRNRSSASKSEEDEDEDEESESEVNVRSRTTAKKTTPEYVNIRRGRVGTTTKTAEKDSESSRNKILGESSSEDDDDEEDDEKDEDDETDSVSKRTYTPQYVNIRRQRPTTTEETSTSKYVILRRGSTTESPAEANDDTDNSTIKYKTIRRGSTPSPSGEENSSSKYQTIRRGTTTQATGSLSESADENTSRFKNFRRGSTTERATAAADTETSRYTTIRSSTVPLDDENDVTSKYNTIRRGTTSSIQTSEDDTSKFQTTIRGSTTLEPLPDTQQTITINSSPNPTDLPSRSSVLSTDSTTALPSSPNSDRLTTNLYQDNQIITTETLLPTKKDTVGIITESYFETTKLDIEDPRTTEDASSSVSTISSTESVTETATSKKRPQLLQPRPFSISTRGSSTSNKPNTESTTQTSKTRNTTLRPFRIGTRRRITTSTALPATKLLSTPAPFSRPTKITRRKYPPPTTRILESQETTSTTTKPVNTRFRFVPRKPILRTKQKPEIVEGTTDQALESSNQQSLEEDYEGGKTTELVDLAIALQDIQQAPVPGGATLGSTVKVPPTTHRILSRVTFALPQTSQHFISKATVSLPETTQRVITKVPIRSRIRYSTTTSPLLPTITTTTTKLISKKKIRPQAFEKIKYTDSSTYRPLSDYDYYDDFGASILGKIPEHSKVLLHGNGDIECLDQGNFPHPVSCKKFISCAKMENGHILGWEYTCPKNLSFDPIGGMCNWSAGLGCSEQ